MSNCKHENTQTITNIYGDLINVCNTRSIKACIDCGKKLKGNFELDNNCNRSNEIDTLHEYHLYGKDIGDVSDGYHTFDELYYHRMILFSIICNTYKDNSWKSKLHNDGTMYDGMFIVGITTPEGDYTYHYDNKYWDMFDVKILDNAPEWDGHKPKDIVRLLSLLK